MIIRNFNKKLDYSDVLYYYYPKSSWRIENDPLVYENIIWHSEDLKKPLKSDLDEKYEELKVLGAKELLRSHRDELIAETDWWVLPDRNPTQEQLSYRQALRDLPQNSTPVLDHTDPLGISGVIWPTKPQ